MQQRSRNDYGNKQLAKEQPQRSVFDELFLIVTAHLITKTTAGIDQQHRDVECVVLKEQQHENFCKTKRGT